jgi:hypothetical protein
MSDLNFLLYLVVSTIVGFFENPPEKERVCHTIFWEMAMCNFVHMH